MSFTQESFADQFAPEDARDPRKWAKSTCKDCHGTGVVHYSKRIERVFSDAGVKNEVESDRSEPCHCAVTRFNKAKKAGQIPAKKFVWDEIIWC